MQKKTIFVSAMAKDEAAVQKLFARIKSYGMDVNGHFWNHEAQDLTKEIPSAEVEKCDAWVIVAPETLDQQSMIGLSLTILTVKAHRKFQVPVLIVGPQQPLTAVLSAAEFCEESKLGAKLVARCALKKNWPEQSFNLCFHNQPGVGFWLEAGPRGETWKGALTGVDTSLGGSLDFLAVGPAGSLPERTVLEYPFKDARLTSGNTEYTAWGCGNKLEEGDSIFVRIKGVVPSLIIGQGLGEEDSMDCLVIKLSV